MKILHLTIQVLLLACAIITSNAKVLIFTYSYNRPDFIEIQNKTFKRFLKDDYEFVVFNDARDPKMYQQIKATCEKLDIECIKIPQEIHNQPYLQRFPGEEWNSPSVRNCNVVMYSLNNYGFLHDDIVVLLDSDMFLVKEFSIQDYMKDYDVAALPQSRGHDLPYLWIGLVFLNRKTMPNKDTISFNTGRIYGRDVDAGGFSHFYLKENPTARIGYFNLCYHHSFACDACNAKRNKVVCTHNLEILKNRNFDENFINFIQSGPPTCYYHDCYMEMLQDQTFLHYRSATNWDGKSADYHRYKTKVLNDYIDAIIR